MPLHWRTAPCDACAAQGTPPSTESTFACAVEASARTRRNVVASARLFTRRKRARVVRTGAAGGNLYIDRCYLHRRAGTGGKAERPQSAEDRPEGGVRAQFPPAPGRLPRADQPALVHARAAREDRGH